jgi:GTPase SAR1 family protein
VPIDWVAISAAIAPYIKKYASSRVGKIASQQIDTALARAMRPEHRLVIANDIFVSRFGKELESAIDLETLTKDSYQRALAAFLANPSVQDVLLGTLDGHSELDWQLLRGIWSEFRTSNGERIIELPADFDWKRVGNTYAPALQRRMLSDSELRPIAEAAANVRTADATVATAEALARLVGPAQVFDMARYANSLQITYAHLKLGSLDADWTQYEGRVHLESVYVPQSATPDLPDRDITRDYLQKASHLVPGVTNSNKIDARISRSIMDIAEDSSHRRSVILGDPGLGKSTLLKHLLLRWAENTARPLALFVELRHAANLSRDFLDYLENAPNQTAPLPRRELRNHMVGNETLVMFDGLDEVSETKRPDAVSSIIRFASEYPNARLIVTSRIHGYHPGSVHPERFRDAGFQHFRLHDFEAPQIDQFISLWHREAFRDPTERSRYESRLRRALQESPAINELACNPLLLTMMAVLGRTQDLPRDRGRLYERCAELLLTNWDLEKFPELKERREARDIKDKLGPDQKMRILEKVAAAMQEERTGLEANLISEEKLKKIVSTALGQLDIAHSWSVAEDLIWLLRERNFMLAYLGDRQYAFIHRTFLEYFVARDLKNQLERTSALTRKSLAKIFRERWRRTEWTEVLRLLCGLIGAEYAGFCVSELITQAAKTGDNRAILLAAQCLREVREAGLIREVRVRTREALLRVTRLKDAIKSRAWNPGFHGLSEERSRAIHELARGWRQDPEIFALLQNQAVDDDDPDVRAAAITELAREWTDSPLVLSLVMRMAEQEYRIDVQERATRELARNWSRNGTVLTFLQDRVIRGIETLKHVIVQELAFGWRGDPEVLNWLITVPGHDPSKQVRTEVVNALATSWKNELKTLPALKHFVTNDESVSVRTAALTGIVRGWNEVPDVLEWLKAISAQGAALHIRTECVRAVARTWRNHIQTLKWLQARALSDPDSHVQGAAVREIALGWEGNPEVLRWLMEHVTGHPSPPFRGNIIEALAQGGWKWNSDVLALIKERATSDPDSDIRCVAVRMVALGWAGNVDVLQWMKLQWSVLRDAAMRQCILSAIASGWRDNPETIPWLKEHAVTSEDPVVRSAAIRTLKKHWEDDPPLIEWLKSINKN